MTRLSRCGAIGVLAICLLFDGSAVSTQASVTIGGYELIRDVRVTRTVSELTYRATLTNAGADLAGATAAATSLSPATTLVDWDLTFGAVAAGGSVASSDTFTVRHDRTVPFDASKIVWTIAVTPANHRPLASAGADQTASVGSVVMLSGSGSSDADGDALFYAWTLQSKPSGSTAGLLNPTSVNPSFTIDIPGSYVARLVVSDGSAASLPDTVVISTSNSAPVANAGPDQTATRGQTVTLDGSASSDVDGDPLTFAWTFVSRPSGSAAALSSATAVKPSFVIDVAGTYQLDLRVNDGSLTSSPERVTLRTSNSAPVANAGPDQSVHPIAEVTLDGSGSTDVDGDPLTYSWSLTSVPPGSAASLSNPTAVKPTFTADRAGTYVAQLIVNDGTTASVADTIQVSSLNTAPVANAGEDQTLAVGTTVFLSGAASSDADGDPLAFQWSLTLPAGSHAALFSLNGVGTSFTPDVVGDYIVQLVVNDGLQSSAPDTVSISAVNSMPVARAGADQLEARAGVVATLDGSASSDADGQPLTYQWSLLSKPAGSAAALVAPLSVSPTFTPDLAGDYVAQLIVNDGLVNSAPDTVLIRVGTSPIAHAGPDQTVPAGATVVLDGSASTDPGGSALTFAWHLASLPPGSTAVLSGADTASPTLVADRVGDYVAELTVTNAIGLTGVDSVTITAFTGTLASVSIVAADNTATEAGPTSGTFTITRAGSTASALAVLVSRGGTASTDDYSGPPAGGTLTVTIPAGQTSVDVVVTAAQDNRVEGNETLVLTVAPSAAYAVGAPDSALITFSDDPAIVTVSATDPAAAEAGPNPGVFTVTRTGGKQSSALLVNFALSGTAAAGTDYTGVGASVSIPADQTSVTVTIAPLADNDVEGSETAILTISASSTYNIGATGAGTVTIADDAPVVTVVASDAAASEGGADTGVFRFSRTGGRLAAALPVTFVRSGTATNGVDYASIGASSSVVVTIPASQASAAVTIAPIADTLAEGSETVIATLSSSTHYTIGASSVATVTIGDGTTVVTVVTSDPNASEVALDPGTFTVTRTGPTTSALTVNFTVAGTATSAVDYAAIGTSVVIAAGQASAVLTVTPIADTSVEPAETVLVSLAAGSYAIGTPSGATVTIADDPSGGGVVPNGGTVTGRIAAAGETDLWTFTATAGDRIAVHIGEIVDDNDFRPWIRLRAPNGATLGDTAGTDAAQLAAVAPLTGVYQVIVASFDSGFDGTGTYRLTIAHTPGPITVPTGDEGGPLTNGGMHFGTIAQGDLDVWTFTATAGDRIAVHAGEIVDADDFRPWIRLWAPNGVSLGETAGTDAAELDAVAPVTGTYLVLVASFDSGFDGTGSYRLTMAHTPGPITVSTGDQGGPLTNGATHSGEILQGDLDVWTFTATAGDRIDLHIGEIADTDDFRPWIQLWAPTGATLGSTSGTDAAQMEAVAPVTGTYLVLVASFDSGFDGTGTYRLTMAHTPGPITISPGDQGGPLVNGAEHLGEILQGDLDVWTFTATAGDRIAVHIGELTDADDFRPWIQLWTSTGATLGSTSGTDAAQLEAVAPVTGSYFVLVASFDSGFDGTGTYRLTMAHTPGPITISPGDQGGPLVNGAEHSGEIVQGDLDVWTFTATAGDRITLHIGELTDTDDFRPWIQLWTPTGATLGSTSGTDAAEMDAVAPVTGTYFVLVASFDSGFDGTGTYRLTMAHTPGPITVSPGDQGGPLVNGAEHTGEIVQGDVDVWTFTATAGDRISLHIGEIADTDDFRPWIQLWAPNGATLGSTSGVAAAELDAVAPVTGTYLVLVASFDSGFDGTGTYRLTMTHTPGPITVSPGDEGGALTSGATRTGTIVRGDLDVWTISVAAGQHITAHLAQTSETDDFRPWLQVWAPNGAFLGSTSGIDTAAIINATAPVGGTYLVLVASFDSGFDGTGTYSLEVGVSP